MGLIADTQRLHKHTLLHVVDKSVEFGDIESRSVMAQTNGVEGVHHNGTSRKNGVHVIDERTGDHYNLPISHNAVTASAFQKIKIPENEEYYADQNEQGLRIFDPGFSNTAVSTSEITYV